MMTFLQFPLRAAAGTAPAAPRGARRGGGDGEKKEEEEEEEGGRRRRRRRKEGGGVPGPAPAPSQRAAPPASPSDLWMR